MAIQAVSEPEIGLILRWKLPCDVQTNLIEHPGKVTQTGKLNTRTAKGRVSHADF
jgi:hypothetical protein